jgi:hypothetical protein
VRERGPIELQRIAEDLDEVRSLWLAALGEVGLAYDRIRTLAAARGYFREQGRRGFKVTQLGLDEQRSVGDALGLLRALIPDDLGGVS